MRWRFWRRAFRTVSVSVLVRCVLCKRQLLREQLEVNSDAWVNLQCPGCGTFLRLDLRTSGVLEEPKPRTA